MDQELCIFQWDNRHNIGPSIYLVRENRHICHQSPTCRHFFEASNNSKYPVYWAKIYQVLSFMRQRKACNIILFLDTDTVIKVNVERIVERLSSYSMLISNDAAMNPWTLGFFHKPFNAGAWMVRNNMKGLRILEMWMSTFRSNNWIIHNNTWSCPGCEWAGPSYEQGAFSHTVLPQYYKYIKIVSYKLLNNPGCYRKSDDYEYAFVCHFMFTDGKANIEKYVHDEIIKKNQS